MREKEDEIAEIRNLMIHGHESDMFRLKDIADVREAYENPQRNKIVYDGQTACGIAIAMESGYDILRSVK